MTTMLRYYGATELTGHPDDKWGWAGQLALAIKNIPTGAGDVINIQGVYTDGATRYNIQDLAAQLALLDLRRHQPAGAYQSVGFGDLLLTRCSATALAEPVKTWGMRGAFNHNLDPYWSGAIYGAFARSTMTALAKVAALRRRRRGGRPAHGLRTGATGCNPDYNIGQIGGIIRWTPVKNLTFSADLTYTHLDQKYCRVRSTAPRPRLPSRPPSYELKDQDTVSAPAPRPAQLVISVT